MNKKLAQLDKLEDLTREYANQRRQLATSVLELQEKINVIIAQRTVAIKAGVAKTAEAHDRLKRELDKSPELFVKPRTITIEGIKIGYSQVKAKIDIPNEALTLRKIREKLPKAQAALLIRITEQVDHNACIDFTQADLDRLNIDHIPATDKVVIKPVDTEADKVLKRLLKEIEEGS